MDIQPTLLSASLPSKSASSNLQQWVLGQVLNATVTARKSANTLILQINNQAVEAKTSPDKPLNIGAHLKLIVEKQDNPTLLRVLQHHSPKLIHESRQQLLRENLPKQASLEKLTSILSQLTNNSRAVLKALPAPIELQIKKLIEQLPTQTNLKSESGLKTAVKNSGIFLESKLLTEVNKKQEPTNPLKTTTTSSRPNLANDLKINLLQLSELITKHKQNAQKPGSQLIKSTQLASLSEVAKNTTTNAKARAENTAALIDIGSKVDIESISKQIESSIARIEVNQSKAVITTDNQLPAWSIEIPVKDKHNIDLLKLDIQTDKDSKNANEKEQLWTVNLKINFENKGAISARLSMINKEVSATLWSEDQTLNDLIDNNLLLLNKRIEQCGLSMGKIICLEGGPRDQKDRVIENNLINTSV